MITQVSIGNDPAIFQNMATSLGTYIRDRRIALGFRTQGDFAITAGINRAHLSQIESGKIALPNADLRRKLASALGVSHLDILVAAGELEPDEVEAAGVEGVVDDANSPKARVQRAIDEMAWNDADAEQAIRVIGALRGAFTPRIDPSKYDRKPGNT